jgi:hypothetical protein
MGRATHPPPRYADDSGDVDGYQIRSQPPPIPARPPAPFAPPVASGQRSSRWSESARVPGRHAWHGRNVVAVPGYCRQTERLALDSSPGALGPDHQTLDLVLYENQGLLGLRLLEEQLERLAVGARAIVMEPTSSTRALRWELAWIVRATTCTHSCSCHAVPSTPMDALDDLIRRLPERLAQHDLEQLRRRAPRDRGLAGFQ